MFLFIAKYEWLLLKANKMLLLLAGILVAVLFFALYEGSKRVAFQQETLTQLAAQEKSDYQLYRAQIASAKSGQHFDGGHFGDPTNPFYFGNRMGARYAALLPGPLAILSSGQSDVYPYYYKVTLSKKQALYHNEEPENPQILFNGRFDVSFVIIFLLPLLIIGFTYNVYASEKEGGTLLLLMAQNTPVQGLIACRFLFRYLLFNVFFTLLLVTGLLLFNGKLVAAGTQFLTIVGLTWLYTALWFSLSYWVNSFKKSSGFSATALTGAWLLLVLVVPSLISAVTDAVHPLPSRLALITQTRAVSDSIAKNKTVYSRFLEEHPEFKPAAADPKDRNPATLRSRIEVEMAMEGEKAKFAAVIAEREALVNRYRFFSPAIFVQQNLNEAVGTNDETYAAFDKNVVAFQQSFRAYFAPLVYRQEKFTTAHVDGVPVFFPSPAVGVTSTASWINMAFLFFVSAIVLALAWLNWKEKKREVRSFANTTEPAYTKIIVEKKEQV